MRWSHLHGDMQGGRGQGRVFRLAQMLGKVLSEIPCRVSMNLPRRSVRSEGKPAHIGETLPAKVAAGNPEGSPSDPLTTDPKGEACRASESPKIHAMRNTPALIVVRGAYETFGPPSFGRSRQGDLPRCESLRVLDEVKG